MAGDDNSVSNYVIETLVGKGASFYDERPFLLDVLRETVDGYLRRQRMYRDLLHNTVWIGGVLVAMLCAWGSLWIHAALREIFRRRRRLSTSYLRHECLRLFRWMYTRLWYGVYCFCCCCCLCSKSSLSRTRRVLGPSSWMSSLPSTLASHHLAESESGEEDEEEEEEQEESVQPAQTNFENYSDSDIEDDDDDSGTVINGERLPNNTAVETDTRRAGKPDPYLSVSDSWTQRTFQPERVDGGGLRSWLCCRSMRRKRNRGERISNRSEGLVVLVEESLHGAQGADPAPLRGDNEGDAHHPHVIVDDPPFFSNSSTAPIFPAPRNHHKRLSSCCRCWRCLVSKCRACLHSSAGTCLSAWCCCCRRCCCMASSFPIFLSILCASVLFYAALFLTGVIVPVAYSYVLYVGISGMGIVLPIVLEWRREKSKGSHPLDQQREDHELNRIEMQQQIQESPRDIFQTKDDTDLPLLTSGPRSQYPVESMTKEDMPDDVSTLQDEHLYLWRNANDESSPHSFLIHPFSGIENESNSQLLLSPILDEVSAPAGFKADTDSGDVTSLSHQGSCSFMTSPSQRTSRRSSIIQSRPLTPALEVVVQNQVHSANDDATSSSDTLVDRTSPEIPHPFLKWRHGKRRDENLQDLSSNVHMDEADFSYSLWGSTNADGQNDKFYVVRSNSPVSPLLDSIDILVGEGGQPKLVRIKSSKKTARDTKPSCCFLLSLYLTVMLVVFFVIWACVAARMYPYQYFKSAWSLPSSRCAMRKNGLLGRNESDVLAFEALPPGLQWTMELRMLRDHHKRRDQLEKERFSRATIKEFMELEFFDAFLEYISFHRSEMRRSPKEWKDRPPKLLVFSMSNDGLGNRLQALVSTLMMAMVTRRILLVHWPAGDMSSALFPDLFVDPGFSWNIQDVSEDHVRALNLSPNSIITKSYGYCRTCSYQIGDGDFEFYRGLFEREDLGVPEKDTVVRVISTQWFGASIARNRPLREKICSMFGNNFHTNAMRLLLSPSSLVRKQVLSSLETLLDSSRGSIVGTQIRRTEAYSVSVEQEQAIWRCAQGAVESRPRPVFIIIASDSSEARLKLKNAVHFLRGGYEPQIRDNVRLIDLSESFQSVIGSENDVISKSSSGVQSSLAEIFLLSVADELVLSSYSTFGYISASLNGRPSYFVTRDQMCMRAISSEPCPQYWYSLYYQPWFHLNAFESGDGTNFHRCML